ncbi:tRNA (N6-threonylcarbamoyladenosine(37)-N6)-methyltransferase TrmO [Alteromonas sp. ALT199]|uniref:tRNA (N6-threonylcarbamoyladenosine(37)-N6)-methyltransferase TrmO n=1 Tax=unclassified Alteromonas TaxID=2614992 RepID=UPI00044DADAF|nr:tRNA (N6-threonylcarbamoyladenosine(37)-N6)-methyltransferase TrmO [Alteromonas sp. ALT199]MBT3134182.1 tRNA (N6-threonylcarbamoyladenosine(37)-N6)-methyltransferase TrmO [Alteromonas sp. ALT199]
MTTHSSFTVTTIATIATPFKQKFAIPRQPNLAKAQGLITFEEGFSDVHMLKGIENYSHLWLLFIFHQNLERGWKNTVKAPRLGGNASMGVLASRSTHRPNGIGMSVVTNKGTVTRDGKTQLLVEGVDLVDGTPLIDIKPYIAYADSIPAACDRLDELNPIPYRKVSFLARLKPALAEIEKKHNDFSALVTSVLSQDPRPAYKQQLDNEDKTYRVTLYNIDVGFEVKDGAIWVTELVHLG